MNLADAIRTATRAAAEKSERIASAKDEALAAANHVRALWDAEAIRQSGDWWHAVGTLMGALDALDAAERAAVTR